MTLNPENTQENQHPTQSELERDPSSISDTAAQVRLDMSRAFQEMRSDNRESQERHSEVLLDIYNTAMARIEKERLNGTTFESKRKIDEGGGSFSTEVFLKDTDDGAYRIYASRFSQEGSSVDPWTTLDIGHYSNNPNLNELRDDLSLSCTYKVYEKNVSVNGYPHSVTTENAPQLMELVATLPVIDKNDPMLESVRKFNAEHTDFE
jgi:hypothetical protein